MIDVTEQESLLARVMSELSHKTPRNELGFPLGYYRCDLLPLHDYQPEEAALEALLNPISRDDATLFNERTEEVIQNAEGEIDAQGQEGQEAEESLGPPDLQAEEEDIFGDQPLMVVADDAGKGDLRAIARSASPLDRRSAQPQLPHPVSDRLAGFRRQDLLPAFVPLSFDEGFPALPDGRPYWEQLEHEPREAHIALQAYLLMTEVSEGTRNLSGLPAVMAANKLLPEVIGEVIEGALAGKYIARFRMYYSVYCWGSRTRGYDLYKQAAYRKQQEHRALTIQDSHYSVATKLFNRLLAYMEDEDDFWDMMSPKVAIEMMKMLTGMQRVSVGLPAGAPLKEGSGDGLHGHSFELILRTLAQQGRAPAELEATSGNSLGVGGGGGGTQASKILANPELTQLAQELIIRMTRGG